MKLTKQLVLAVSTVLVGVASTFAGPVIDGLRDDAIYGAAATVQTVNTQFGDNQSELDAFYFNYDAASNRMNILLTGNIESNDNKVVLFLDTRAGGQNTLRNDNPSVNFNQLNLRYGQQQFQTLGVFNPTGGPNGNGLTGPGFTFDTGFDADYFLSFNRTNANGGTLYSDYAELRTTGGGVGGFLGSVPAPNLGHGAGTIGGTGGLPSIDIGYDDTNAAGVVGGTTAADPAAAAAVTQGLEFSIDMAAFDITSSFKIVAFVNGAAHDYVSNQILPGFVAPQSNLGSDGNGNYVSLGTNADGSDRRGTSAFINLNNFAGNQYLTVPIVLPILTYNVNANGNISNPSNFSPNGVPTGANGRVVFGSVITAPRTVTVDQDVSLFSLTFDNANRYTLAGTNTISIVGSPATPAVKVLSGSHVISAPIAFTNDVRIDVAASSGLSLTGAVSAAGKDVFKLGAGSLEMTATNANSLTVNGGSLKLLGTGHSKVRGVTIDAGAVLNLGGASLLVDYDDGFSPLPGLQTAIADGRLTSSNITGPSRAIGYADTATYPALTSYDGEPLDATALVFVATLKGDANLDKTVNFDDLLILAQNYSTTTTGRIWTQGDSNGDGLTNFDDLLSLAQNYLQSAIANGTTIDGATASAAFQHDWALALSLVPEPASLSLLGFGALAMRRRK